jgi:hypothetical protein
MAAFLKGHQTQHGETIKRVCRMVHHGAVSTAYFFNLAFFCFWVIGF